MGGLAACFPDQRALGALQGSGAHRIRQICERRGPEPRASPSRKTEKDQKFALRFHKWTLLHLESVLSQQGKEQARWARPATPMAHAAQTADLVGHC